MLNDLTEDWGNNLKDVGYLKKRPLIALNIIFPYEIF